MQLDLLNDPGAKTSGFIRCRKCGQKWTVICWTKPTVLRCGVCGHTETRSPADVAETLHHGQGRLGL